VFLFPLTSGSGFSQFTKNDSSSMAPEAVSQPINGCAAQQWGQLLMFEGKSCSHGGSGSLQVIPAACY
jgi:hypothetical protein